MFRRKIYKQMLAWKEESHGNTSLLIEANVVWAFPADNL